MGRPAKETVEYFPLYTEDSRTLQILESKYGGDGFIFYHKLLKLLGGEDGHFYIAKDQMDIDYLVQKFKIDEDKIFQMLDDLSSWGKIDSKLWQNHRAIWYQGFVDTLAEAYRKRTNSLPTISRVYAELDDFEAEDSNEDIVSAPEIRQKPTNEIKLNKTKYLKKQQAAKKKSTPDGDAAAAFSESELKLIRWVTHRRIKQSGKGSFKKLYRCLLTSAEADPGELLAWQAERTEHRNQIAQKWRKRVELRRVRNHQHKAKQERAAHEKKRKSNLAAYKNLPQKLQQDYWDTALNRHYDNLANELNCTRDEAKLKPLHKGQIFEIVYKLMALDGCLTPTPPKKQSKLEFEASLAIQDNADVMERFDLLSEPKAKYIKRLEFNFKNNPTQKTVGAILSEAHITQLDQMIKTGELYE